MSRGGFHNRQAIIIMIQAAPPHRPPCFSTDKAWKDWLVQAHLSGVKVARRSEHPKVNGQRVTSQRLLPKNEIAYCTNCTIGYQTRMQAQGRCHPSPVMMEEEATA